MTNRKYGSEYARKPPKLLKSMVTKLLPALNSTKLSTKPNNEKGPNLMNKSLPFMKKSIEEEIKAFLWPFNIESKAKSDGEENKTSDSLSDEEREVTDAIVSKFSWWYNIMFPFRENKERSLTTTARKEGSFLWLWRDWGNSRILFNRASLGHYSRNYRSYHHSYQTKRNVPFLRSKIPKGNFTLWISWFRKNHIRSCYLSWNEPSIP